ncbi:MAG: hypothetical protein M1133_00320 [Armatimonadetes bacterium]|nr:hypothetical protein [Armatimonadota bacterium]
MARYARRLKPRQQLRKVGLRRFNHALIACMTGLCTSALAHGDAEELGHHWEVKSYVGEMHFQIAVMVVAALAIAAGKYLLRFWRNWSAER